MGPCDGLKQFYNQWQRKSGVIESSEEKATTWLVLGAQRSAITVRCEEVFYQRGAALTIRQIAGKDDPGKLHNTLLATGPITVKPGTSKATVPWFIFKTRVQLPIPDAGLKIEEETST